MLRFSIIIPTLNRRRMLRAALQSVVTQEWEQTETLVVDGGSEDGTIEDLMARPDVHLIKAPGSGVYEALNVGLAHTSGDVIGLLNSDDAYEPQAFVRSASTLEAHPELDGICGSAVLVADHRVVTTFNKESDKVLASPRTALIGCCMPNARFFRRRAIELIGPFDLCYQYVADRDWLLRWYEAGLKMGAVPEVVYRYQQHSGSLTFNAERRHERAIREELLLLATRWQAASHATSETRRIAEILEGRNLAKLAMFCLRDGAPVRAARLLLKSEGALSLRPLSKVSRGVLDWIAERSGVPETYS